jgi:hypothetical protein
MACRPTLVAFVLLLLLLLALDGSDSIHIYSPLMFLLRNLPPLLLHHAPQHHYHHDLVSRLQSRSKCGNAAAVFNAQTAAVTVLGRRAVMHRPFAAIGFLKSFDIVTVVLFFFRF